MAENIPLFPVAGWEISSIPSYDAIAVKLDFLASPMQSEPSPGRSYLLGIQQAKELAQRITALCEKAEAYGFERPPGPAQ